MLYLSRIECNFFDKSSDNVVVWMVWKSMAAMDPRSKSSDHGVLAAAVEESSGLFRFFLFFFFAGSVARCSPLYVSCGNVNGGDGVDDDLLLVLDPFVASLTVMIVAANSSCCCCRRSFASSNLFRNSISSAVAGRLLIRFK